MADILIAAEAEKIMLSPSSSYSGMISLFAKTDQVNFAESNNRGRELRRNATGTYLMLNGFKLDNLFEKLS